MSDASGDGVGVPSEEELSKEHLDFLAKHYRTSNARVEEDIENAPRVFALRRPGTNSLVGVSVTVGSSASEWFKRFRTLPFEESSDVRELAFLLVAEGERGKGYGKSLFFKALEGGCDAACDGSRAMIVAAHSRKEGMEGDARLVAFYSKYGKMRGWNCESTNVGRLFSFVGLVKETSGQGRGEIRNHSQSGEGEKSNADDSDARVGKGRKGGKGAGREKGKRKRA